MRSQNYLILPVLLVVGAVCSCAQTPDPRPAHAAVQTDRPPLTPLPAEQDWGFLRDASKRVDPLDKLKYVPIGDCAQCYLSLGLDYRSEYEYFDNWAMRAGPQDHDGYLLNRVVPHFDLHLGTEIRLFTEFQFDYEAYRNGGPRPGLDEDKGDIHQSFLEVGSRVSHERGFSLRAGRQEIVLGTGKLFDDNEGLNVKLSFDGVRLIAQSRSVRWDVFAAKPVEDNPGFFDDGPIHTQTTWGSYLTVPFRLDTRGFTDLYYLGLSTKNASYNRGSASSFDTPSAFAHFVFRRAVGTTTGRQTFNSVRWTLARFWRGTQRPKRHFNFEECTSSRELSSELTPIAGITARAKSRSVHTTHISHEEHTSPISWCLR
jgi:hypothetical protein